jgi:high-affinity nickel permease
MLLGYVVWGVLGAVIGIIELLAAINSDWTPWTTLSSTVGELQDNHSWVGIFVVGAIVVMAMRILFYPWPYKEGDT